MLPLLATLFFAGCTNIPPGEAVVYNPYYGYGGFYPSQSQGMYLQAGMCDDPASGGQANCSEIASRGRSYYGPAFSSGYYARPSVPIVVDSDSTLLIHRGGSRDGHTARQFVSGPTVDNYLEITNNGLYKIDPQCRFKNREMAGTCLLGLVPQLEQNQRECVKAAESLGTISVMPICHKEPGKWAKIYSRLGNDLLLSYQRGE